MLPTGADEQATIVCQVEVGGVWVGSMEAPVCASMVYRARYGL